MSGSGVKNLDYELAKETLDFLQEGYPARLHRTYVLNAPLWFRAAVRLFKPFLKKKVCVDGHSNNKLNLICRFLVRTPAQLSF